MRSASTAPRTLVGQTNVFAPSSATLTLGGVITDGANSRALIKEGGSRLVIANAANTYDGVTAIKDGFLTINAGAKMGTGKVFVNGGVLSLSAANPDGCRYDAWGAGIGNSDRDFTGDFASNRQHGIHH